MNYILHFGEDDGEDIILNSKHLYHLFFQQSEKLFYDASNLDKGEIKVVYTSPTSLTSGSMLQALKYLEKR